MADALDYKTGWLGWLCGGDGIEGESKVGRELKQKLVGWELGWMNWEGCRMVRWYRF